MDATKPRNLALPIAVIVIVLMLAGASSVLIFGDRWTRQELRGISLKISQYLVAHDGRWPQPPGSTGLTSPPNWWATDPAQLRSGVFQIAKFDDTPNIAFYNPRKPWVTYTAWNGRRYELLPDGSIAVTEKP
jgi:hypothetical protein